jgi:hypothetical protein
MFPEFYRKLPRRVYVGQYEFTLAVVETEDESLAGCDGMTYLDQRRIFIDGRLPLRRFVAVVLHEVKHALHWERGLDDGMSEEHFTTESANGETELWVDNPRLFSWFDRAYKDIRKQGRERATVSD